ncbi:MAG: four helix bundle protein [Candidatus Microgenomates bacterium]
MEFKNHKSRYDLEERTANFGENVIKLCQKIEKDCITKPLITQLIKSATSIGANYSEADDAESKYDFKHKIGIVKKECRETKHFIRMLVVAYPKIKEEARILWQEAKELHLIFNKIFHSIK